MKALRIIGGTGFFGMALAISTNALTVADTQIAQGLIGEKSLIQSQSVHRVGQALAEAERYSATGITGYKWSKAIQSPTKSATPGAVEVRGGNKWSQVNTAEQTGNKWGRSNTSEQVGNKWGRSNASEQMGNKWGRSNTSEQVGNKWGRSNASEQVGNKWGRSNTSEQVGNKWGRSNASEQVGNKWGRS